MSTSRTLARKREVRASAWGGNSQCHNEKKKRGKASKENLPRRSRTKQERVSGRKSSPGRSAESWFHFKSGQIEMGKKVGRRSTSSQDDKAK